MPRRRALPMPKGWDRIRARILRRDHHRCQWPTGTTPAGICGEPANQVDHKIGAATGTDDHSDTNLWALCQWHHDRKTAHEASAIAHALPPRDRPREPHPGLINPT
ncbi:HNH endonuclease [Streptomyces synnematoformans]|uniref:HNH endonuclease n=1 Tax=Streptomyces synnematoformans TaxID=415721 RepID=A0ABN2XAV8_9ACTN